MGEGEGEGGRRGARERGREGVREGRGERGEGRVESQSKVIQRQAFLVSMLYHLYH